MCFERLGPVGDDHRRVSLQLQYPPERFAYRPIVVRYEDTRPWVGSAVHMTKVGRRRIEPVTPELGTSTLDPMTDRDADPRAAPPQPKRGTTLRGSTAVSAPLTLLGVIGSSIALVSVLWMVGSEHGATTGAWINLAGGAVIGIAGFVGARGCRVRIVEGRLSDVVAWRTVRCIECDTIQAIRVRRGPWRTFEIELDDGTRRVVLGAGPVQFPAYLLADAADRDLHAIDLMRGGARS